MLKEKIAVCAVLLLIGNVWAASVESITTDQKSLVIDTIKGYPEVVSASMGQAESHLYLVVVVKPGTSSNVARNMGDNFVRMVKRFGPDTAPRKEIGHGKYNYHVKVKVLSPTIRTLVSGYKADDDIGIAWE